MACTASLLHDPIAAAILGLHDTSRSQQHSGASNKYIDLHIDFLETETAYKLLADMPGLGQQDVNLELQNRTLVVSGEPAAPTGSAVSSEQGKDADSSEAAKTAKFASLRRKAYKRTVQLPNDVDETGIGASMDKGVLEVILPKRKSALPRQIAVSGPAGLGQAAAPAV
mmetsp:Transcript_31991/g.82862  ORF Transcript_31991/g.82862 Transcript_31991/m.82862 type:complete len:169 (-) Transcript_31991:120-626(-)